MCKCFYKTEILCRWEHYGWKNGENKASPQSNQWTLTKVFKWLNEHLIFNKSDIQFIQEELENHKHLDLKSKMKKMKRDEEKVVHGEA